MNAARSVVSLLFEVILIVTSIVTITGFLAAFGFPFELTSHFRVQYVAIALLLLPFSLMKQSRRPLMLALLIILVNASEIAPIYLPRAHLSARLSGNVTPLSLLSVNVERENRNYTSVIDYIRAVKPQVIGFIEVDDPWITGLADLRADYPYATLQPRDDNFGIGILSQIPIEGARVQDFGDQGFPSIVSQLQYAGRPVTLVLTHLFPPVSPAGEQQRNHQLEAIAARRPDFNKTLILIGDLNTTSWSTFFKNVIDKTDLYDSRQGFGIQASWPTLFPLMLVPIDHCLVSTDITVLDRALGPNIGSDHYPLYVKLGFSGRP